MARYELRIKHSVAKDLCSFRTRRSPEAIQDVHPAVGAPAEGAIRHSVVQAQKRPSGVSIASSDDVRSRHCPKGVDPMRTTINLDDALLAEAQRLTGLSERTALVREGLKALIERERARRLARLGGSEPSLQPIPRRRAEPA